MARTVDDNPHEKKLSEKIASLPERPGLRRAIRAACLSRGVHYDAAPGKRIPIDVMPAPSLLSEPRLRFLHRLSETINTYVRRMPDLYAKHAEVRALLPFGDHERSWIEDCWREEHKGVQTIVGRNDFDMPRVARNTVAFETNGCSIGGLFYASECARVIDDHVLKGPELAQFRKRLRPLDDPCEIATKLLRSHARALGLPPRFSVGILENREWDTGITEMPSLARHLERRGHAVVIGDPRELRVGRGGLHIGRVKVDLLYRNMEITDLGEIEAGGARLHAMREAFRANVVVSGLAGDFDHKSIWEVLTARATRHLVEAPHRSFLRKHLLWTRLLRATRTDDPDGREIDLADYVYRHREELVLKPNQSCGGDGVTIGPLYGEIAWRRAVDRALRKEGTWVVQRFHEGTRKRFPGYRRSDGPGSHYYVTYGVISAPFGQGILGRASRRAVVNVSRGGGLVALFATNARPGRTKSRASPGRSATRT